MDSWILQLDTRKQLEEGAVDSGDYIIAYEKSESLIERRFVLINPLSRRRCFNGLNRGHTFNEDTQRVQFPFVTSALRHSYEPQIAPRFWKYSKKRGLGAALNEDGEMLFEWHHKFSEGTEETRFTIKEDLVLDDLSRHKLCALWCVDSIRFSEKTVAELGLQESREVYRGHSYVYQHLIADRPGFRFRMHAVSIITGKRLIAS